MTTTNTDLSTVSTQILKTDCMGRIRFPAEMREELLNRFEQSEMSGAEFAEFYQLKYTTFASWRQKRERERRKAGGDHEPAGFVEVALPVNESASASGLRVELPGGALVRIGTREEARLAAELLAALGERAC